MRYFIPWLLIAPLLAQDITIDERMRVLQYIIEVRVLAADGAPIMDLQPEDLKLTNHGQEIPIQSLIWIDQTRPQEPESNVSQSTSLPEPTPLPDRVGTRYGGIDTSLDPIGKAPPETRPPVTQSHDPSFDGRLLAIFIQNDLGSNRNQGLVQMIHHGKKILDALTPRDWVAVFSHDSHLKMHLDFTRDRDAAREAIDRCLRKVPGKVIFGGDPPSVADAFNIDHAEDAAAMETAVTVLARALGTLPGEKIMAWIGWGFGNLDQSGVKMNSRYNVMLDALYAADVTVFSLDLTKADYHSLEIAMMRVAGDTGGFYERTANHPSASIQRFVGAIRGYYQLSFAIHDTSRLPRLDLVLPGKPKARIYRGREMELRIEKSPHHR